MHTGQASFELTARARHFGKEAAHPVSLAAGTHKSLVDAVVAFVVLRVENRYVARKADVVE